MEWPRRHREAEKPFLLNRSTSPKQVSESYLGRAPQRATPGSEVLPIGPPEYCGRPKTLRDPYPPRDAPR